jgi:acetylornithine deacetylase
MSVITPPLKDMVSALVGTPSVSSTQPEFDQSNHDVINLLANWLDPVGFQIDITPVEGEPGKSNLIARIGEGADGLVLSGHSDTVPFDEHLWHSDPFTISEKDDKWYGLGSCDMKSFFAIALEAAKPFLDQKLKSPLIIMATADEESSMCGAKQLTRADVHDAAFAVIGEPTGLKPITRHKGIMMFNLRIDGTSGHSSDPELGNNAIEGMQLALDELMDFKKELETKFQDQHFAVAHPTLNFGCIHGGDNPNRICDHTELAFDFRNLPSMDMAGFNEELLDRVRKRISNHGFKVSLDLLHSPVPAFDNADSALAKNIEDQTGAVSGSVAFGTEAPFLNNLQLDTVVIGPGSINQAHQPNEYLPLDQIDPAVELLRTLIKRYCLQA